MDLKERLKLKKPALSDCLEDIKKSCEKIWEDKLMQWFTNHDIEHSEEIIYLLGQILEPVAELLDEQELFIPLASAYLHDIGMQCLKVKDIRIDKLTEKEYNIVRKIHAEQSYNIILKRTEAMLARDDFHLPDIDEEYLGVIALVAKGHSTDYFEEVIEEFKNDPPMPNNRRVKADLLVALLMIADELDLQNKRVKFSETAKFNLSDYSEIHWYKHHYVKSIEVIDGMINIALRFPENSEAYSELFRELIEEKLKEQIGKVNPILDATTKRALYLNDNIKISCGIDPKKRPLPAGALVELKKMLKKKDEIKVLEDEETKDTFTNIPEPVSIFTGRKTELKDFKERFDKSNIISIEGIGGIGKTEFAAKCIEECNLRDRVVWFECFPDSKLDTLITCAGYPEVIKGEHKTEIARCESFIRLIEKDQKVIFLDNFQDITENSFTQFLKTSSKYLKKARIVLITRERPNIDVPLAPVMLGGLKDDAFDYTKAFIDTYYPNVEASEKDIRDICKGLDGYPLAIQLAVELMSYGEPHDDIIRRIIADKGTREKLSSRLLDEIFAHSKSTEDEKQFMIKFSVFRGKVSRNALNYLFADEDFGLTLRHLINKRKITFMGGFYETHPIIREFCYEKLENKKKLHIKVAEYFKTERKEKIDPVLEENVFYHLLSAEQFEEMVELILQNGRTFIRSGHTNSLKDMMDTCERLGFARPELYLFYGDIAEIKGDWNEAIEYYEKTYSHEGIDRKVSSEALIKYGEMLFRKGETGKALRYFEDGCKICREIGNLEGEARSLNDIGLVYDLKGNMLSAESNLNQALRIHRDINNEEGIAVTLGNVGSILKTKGDLKGAIEKCNESLEIRKRIEDQQGIATSLNNIGNILEKKGDLKGAMKKYNESLEIRKRIEEQQGIAASLNDIGGILWRKGNLKGAMEKYNESLEIRKRIEDPQGIVISLNDIGIVLEAKGDLEGAMQKYNEYLRISEQISDMSGKIVAYHNIGACFIETKNYSEALQNLFKSLSLKNCTGIKEGEAIYYILKIKRTIGFAKFKELAQCAFEKLEDDLKPYLNIEELLSNQTVHNESVKVGRNDPCPCGSGKKYKLCCGEG